MNEFPMDIQLEKLKCYKGHPLPGNIKDENLEETVSYKPLPGDVILCSYPKTGNTWMSNILWQILHKAEPIKVLKEARNRYGLVPCLERTGIGPIVKMRPPRFYRTHLSSNLLSLTSGAKYVYTYRNPEDTFVSFYNYLGVSGRIRPDLDSFFEKFMDGTCVYGDYFDHLYAAYSRKDEANFLFVSYEDLKMDTPGQLRRIAQFLGDEYLHPLLHDNNVLPRILEVTGFEYMKKNSFFSVVPGQEGEAITLNVYRKGEVGEGKIVLNERQRDMLKIKVHSKLKGTEYAARWGC